MFRYNLIFVKIILYYRFLINLNIHSYKDHLIKLYLVRNILLKYKLIVIIHYS